MIQESRQGDTLVAQWQPKGVSTAAILTDMSPLMFPKRGLPAPPVTDAQGGHEEHGGDLLIDCTITSRFSNTLFIRAFTPGLFTTFQKEGNKGRDRQARFSLEKHNNNKYPNLKIKN